MKVFKELSLSDQKSIFENNFIWDNENGDKPCRPEYRAWILNFFNSNHISKYIYDLKSDISVIGLDFPELVNSYNRQIIFLQSLK